MAKKRKKKTKKLRKARETAYLGWLSIVKYWKILFLGLSMIIGYFWFQGRVDVPTPKRPKTKLKKVPKRPKSTNWEEKIRKDIGKIEKERRKIKKRNKYLKMINKNYKKKGKK